MRAVAARKGCTVVKVYADRGISGAKGRDKRPGFDALCKDAVRREFDVVLAWSVDRLGRSLQDLIGFLSEIHAAGVDPISAVISIRLERQLSGDKLPLTAIEHVVGEFLGCRRTDVP